MTSLQTPIVFARLSAGQISSWGACRGHLTLDGLFPSLRQYLMTSSSGLGVHLGFLAPPGWTIAGSRRAKTFRAGFGSWSGRGRGLSLFLTCSQRLMKAQARDLGTVWSCHRAQSTAMEGGTGAEDNKEIAEVLIHHNCVHSNKQSGQAVYAGV